VTDPRVPPDSDARVAALYRVLGGVIHDLSNPLQALVMHAELAADDEPGSPHDTERRAAELTATRRLQTIVRALTGLAAAGVVDRPLGDVARRFETLLSHRWTRLGLRLDARIHDRRNVAVPAALEEALLLTGVELSEWLRPRPAKDASLILEVVEGEGTLSLELGCDDATLAAAMCDGLRERLSVAVALEDRVTVNVGGSVVALRCRPRGQD
jgi:signal transduction histidine kinase